MSAQYRPYRDEDSVDGLEATSWSDQEPGTIQIYEKTTEELPFSTANKRALWTQLALLVTIGILGFLLGYFAPFHRTMIMADLESEAGLHGSPYLSREDPTIKDKLLAKIDGQRILDLLTKYQDTQRIPGSDHDHEFARHINDLFLEYGLDRVSVTNYTFETMLPNRPSLVALLNKENKTLYSNLEHEQYAHDDMRPILPLSQANASVIISNQILYVNKGTKADYKQLNSLGLNETFGKVFVLRQGFHEAHDAVIEAQEYGARAVLLFPDPDLFGENSPFPQSVRLPNDAGKSHPTAWSNYGDLASFNLSAAGIDATKLGLDKEAKVQIPVVPISYNTAHKLLRGLVGVPAPTDWNCFDYTLYLGYTYREENNDDGRAQVKVEFHNEEVTISSTTVTGIIKGSIEPDRYVIIGSRRDSLNRGLLDSVSGTAIMLELARVFSTLVSEGWRPRRTIIFNSFGAESLNLIGSSHWLETNQRVLHSRAVAYVNCDLVVTGNRSISIAATPLLYQVLYNATKQVANPDGPSTAENKLDTVYDAWTAAHIHKHRKNISGWLEKAEHSYKIQPKPLFKTEDLKESNLYDDLLGSTWMHGSILQEYKKSATVADRPRVRKLDLQAIYSPFFLYAGIPVVDVRYAGFSHQASNTNSTNLLEDTMPLIGTKYDNLAAIQHIDPHLKYHVAVAKVLSEILRDLSDSAFLPFNLLDYAITLRDNFIAFATSHGHKALPAIRDLDSLGHTVQEFLEASIKFHHRQDQVDSNNAMAIRNFNDQLMLLERAFLDPNGTPNYWERKHIILAPNDGQDRKEGFPGLVDLFTLLDDENMDPTDLSIFVEILRVHYKAVSFTISNAIKIIDDVFVL